MTRRRRPAGDRGTASARTRAGGSGQSRKGATAEVATRQLPLPLPADPQPLVALPPADTASLARPRVLPTVPAAAARADKSRKEQCTEHQQTHPHAEAAQAREVRPSGPRRSHLGVHAHLDDVRSALEDGWEIVQPIFARPLWSVADNSATAFNFVLRRERATRLVTVPEGRSVQRFIRDHHLAVDYHS